MSQLLPQERVTSHSFDEKPDIHDLYIINLHGSDMWYQLGLELGLSVETLEAIKAEHSKPQACKKAMFREWLKTCPVAICTWSRLIQALAKLDLKTAQSVSETISTDSKEMQQEIHQFTLTTESKATSSVSPITAGGKYSQPQTKSVGVGKPSSPMSLAVHQSINVSVSERQPLPLGHPVALESGHITAGANVFENISTHGFDAPSETRSASADDYQTADEDEILQLFSYNHSGEVPKQRRLTNRSKDQVCTSYLRVQLQLVATRAYASYLDPHPCICITLLLC